MKKTVLTSIAFCLLTVNVAAIKVKFTVTNMSVNVAEGSIGIFASFQIYPNNFTQQDSADWINLVDFPSIDYNTIDSVIIEKIKLGENNPLIFQKTGNSFVATDSISYGNIADRSIVKGSTYAYRLKIITQQGQSIVLMNKSSTTEIAHPKMNCAKINNVYRKACHNCFQESIVHPSDGGFYQALFYTRIVELDVHSSSSYPTTLNWDVRHTSGLYQGPINWPTSKNNCSSIVFKKNQGFRWCLKNLITWHNDHPNHDAIILFIDLKSDWNEHNNQQTPADLDQRLLALVSNSDVIYKPKDLLGPNSDMRLAAQHNNWPSMGDLTGKIMFVLTGKDDKLNKYMADQQLNAVAFCAPKVKTTTDASALPNISANLRKNIVFYNLKQFDKSTNTGNSDFNIGYQTSALGYINRTYGTGFSWTPGNYNNSQYTHAINFNMNNIAVANITSTFNSTYPDHGIQWKPVVENASLSNNHIFSTHANVTQAATKTIKATTLKVHGGTHYRMIAGKKITLKPGTHIKYGADALLRIDNCEGANYNLKPIPKLKQATIDSIIHELDKERYDYHPSDEEEVINLVVYPNPATSSLSIAYTNYLLVPTTFTVRNVMGSKMLSEHYMPQQKGRQQFTVNINKLPAGTYFYTLQVGHQLINGKVIKMKE